MYSNVYNTLFRSAGLHNANRENESCISKNELQSERTNRVNQRTNCNPRERIV